MSLTTSESQLMEDVDGINSAAGIGWTRYVESVGPQGAQGTVRIAALLRIVAAKNAKGMKLNEIGAMAGLEQSTAHRIVSALHSVDFLSRDPQTRRYHLGPLLYELFTTAFPHFNMRDICFPAMANLASRMGDTVYLSVRSGFDGICVERQEGSYPIRTCTLDVGQRRLLGVGAGNLALLSALKDMEINTIMEHNAERYEAYGLSPELLRARIERVREQGYVHQNAVSSTEVKAIALPIRGRTGHPFGALSMTAINARMTEQRAMEVVAALREEIEGLEQRIGELGYV